LRDAESHRSLTRGQGPMRLRVGAFNCASICRAARGASRDHNRRPPRQPGSFRQPLSQWLRHWQGWQARSMRSAHPLPRRQWRQQVMLAFGFSCFWPTRSAARQIRRTPADPPATRASAARSTARVDCHSRLNVRKLLGDAPACIRCEKARAARGAVGGGWSRLT
jgi:hypothetical protein